MKKIYEAPRFVINVFDKENVVTTSANAEDLSNTGLTGSASAGRAALQKNTVAVTTLVF